MYRHNLSKLFFPTFAFSSCLVPVLLSTSMFLSLPLSESLALSSSSLSMASSASFFYLVISLSSFILLFRSLNIDRSHPFIPSIDLWNPSGCLLSLDFLVTPVFDVDKCLFTRTRRKQSRHSTYSPILSASFIPWLLFCRGRLKLTIFFSCGRMGSCY